MLVLYRSAQPLARTLVCWLGGPHCSVLESMLTAPTALRPLDGIGPCDRAPQFMSALRVLLASGCAAWLYEQSPSILALQEGPAG